MVCFGKEDETPPDLRSGIVTKRICRDVWCTLLFAVFWAGMVVVAIAGFKYGDPRLLVVPRDYLNNYCGVENANASNPFANQVNNKVLYYLDPFEVTTDSPNITAICLPSCPNVTEIKMPEEALCQYDITPTTENFLAYVKESKCSPYTYKSKAVLNRCVPLEAIPADYLNQTVSVGNTTVSLDSLLKYGRDTSLQAIADLYITWPLLLVGCGSAIIISFAWLLCAHYIVAIFVWISIILMNILLMGGTALMYLYWNSRKVAYETNSLPSGIATANTKWGNYTSEIPFLTSDTEVLANDVRNSLYAFIVLIIVTVITLLITIAMIKRVKMAIEIIHQASKVFLKMPGLTVMPIFFSLAMVALFSYFITVMMFLVSPTGPVTVEVANLTYSDKNTSRNMIYYHLVGFIWTYYTIIGISDCTVAGAVAQWYWTSDKSQKFRSPVLSSFTRVMFYHLGSILLGSLLITIVELIRIMLYHVQKKVAQSSSSYLKYIVTCAQCCMKIVQMLMKFINKNAYIYIAITGKSFFTSAASATALLLKNAAKTVAVDFITSVVLFFTKISLVALNCGIGWLVLLQLPNLFADITYPLLTIGLLGMITYLIVSVFFGNYDIVVDTIFLSVLEDLDKNDGSPERPYLMNDGLKSILSKKNASVVASKQ